MCCRQQEQLENNATWFVSFRDGCKETALQAYRHLDDQNKSGRKFF